MAVLHFNRPFNSISVILRQWKGDNDGLGAMRLGFDPGPLA